MAVRKLFIVDGPSKWELIISHADGEDVASRKEVWFTCVENPKLKVITQFRVIIRDLSRPLSGGHTWQFKADGSCCGTAVKVSGTYSTATRKGRLYATKK
jgi:hypothetical protein